MYIHRRISSSLACEKEHTYDNIFYKIWMNIREVYDICLPICKVRDCYPCRTAVDTLILGSRRFPFRQ